MFDIDLKSVKLNEHKQLEQRVAYTTAILPNNVRQRGN